VSKKGQNETVVMTVSKAKEIKQAALEKERGGRIRLRTRVEPVDWTRMGTALRKTKVCGSRELRRSSVAREGVSCDGVRGREEEVRLGFAVPRRREEAG
jgi:hypothetical protein